MAATKTVALSPVDVDRAEGLLAALGLPSVAAVVAHALDVAERVYAADLAAAGAPTPVAPVPAAPSPRMAAEDPAIPLDDLMLRRERGLVAGFLRMDGRDWRCTGPTPLEAGCQIRPSILAEYRAQLDGLRVHLARLAEQERTYRAAGLQ